MSLALGAGGLKSGKHKMLPYGRCFERREKTMLCVFVLNGTNQLTLPFQYTSPKYVFAHRAQKTLGVLIENNTLPTRLAMADGRPTNSALRIVHLVLGNT